MQIARKQLSDLTPADYNPRTITDAALAGLRASIHRFGLVEPIIWNERTGNVVGGHQRLKVLVADGVAETDVVVVDLPDTEEKALNVALNNPAIAGEFSSDIESLIIELKNSIPDAVDELLLDQLIELRGDIEIIGNDEDIKTKVHHGFHDVKSRYVKVVIGEIEMTIEGTVYEALDEALKELYDKHGVKYKDAFMAMLRCCIEKIRNH